MEMIDKLKIIIEEEQSSYSKDNSWDKKYYNAYKFVLNQIKRLEREDLK
tara:strand:- start:139 stop:285 length:147 start_codon:yes stop_codon:yes gene_type:complete